MTRRLLCLLPVIALSACVGMVGDMAGRATEDWTKTYQLSPGGELHIGNTNGRVQIEGVDGNTVEIHAEKIAKAVSDDAAKELLPRIKIDEEVKPDRISIETGKLGGIMLGASIEVRYTVKAPKNAVIDVSNTNGLVTVRSLTGKVRAHTTNGGVRGDDVTGPVEASATNGGVNFDFASVGTGPIELSTTNGGVTVQLPDDAKADVVATCTNGGINVSDGVKIDVTEQSRRRVEGKMNGGGARIELKTTNGGVRIRSHREARSPKDTDSR
jgi:Putative adhesin